MKRLALFALACLLSVPAFGAYTGTPWRWGRTAAIVGDLPTCNSTRTNVVAYVTAAAAYYKCNGSAWAVAFSGTPGVIDNLTFAGNTLTVTDSGGGFTIDTNGAGDVVIAGSDELDVSKIKNTGAMSIIATAGALDISNTGSGNAMTFLTDDGMSFGAGADAEIQIGQSTGEAIGFFWPMYLHRQVFTVADRGNGSPAAGTLTPSRNFIRATCNDADGCSVTWSESDPLEGMVVTFVNVGANIFTIADSAGVQETTGALTLGQWDNVQFTYATDRWVQSGPVMDL